MCDVESSTLKRQESSFISVHISFGSKVTPEENDTNLFSLLGYEDPRPHAVKPKATTEKKKILLQPAAKTREYAKESSYMTPELAISLNFCCPGY